LVLVNGKLSLQQIATQLKDVPEEKLRKLALNLEQKGYIQHLKVGGPAKEAAFDVIDFFSGRSVDSAANGAQIDQDHTRKLEAGAQSFTSVLKSQGYAVRIARQVGETIKPTSGNAYSVLYIDDAQTLMTAVCAFLEMEGFLPRRAANRLEVVAELRKVPSPDLILLDVELPDINGFNILGSLRSHPELKHIPVIMITGRATREDVMRAPAAGANGYITKLLEFDSLLAAIKAVLDIGLKPRPEA
jgi:PleD family two-component response regulator